MGEGLRGLTKKELHFLKSPRNRVGKNTRQKESPGTITEIKAGREKDNMPVEKMLPGWQTGTRSQTRGGRLSSEKTGKQHINRYGVVSWDRHKPTGKLRENKRHPEPAAKPGND